MLALWQGHERACYLDKCFCYITQTACPSQVAQPLCHCGIAQLSNTNANLIIYFGFRFHNELYLRKNLVLSSVFLQLDNYKAFQFSEQEINDMKISSYLKTVILCTSTHPPLEGKLNSEDSPEVERKEAQCWFKFRVKWICYALGECIVKDQLYINMSFL